MTYALLFSVFVIASCGLVYELIAGALASYLLGDSVTQFSTIIGTYLFAMGIGSLAVALRASGDWWPASFRSKLAGRHSGRDFPRRRCS
jgi:predicted membrane-bound spermidine synthase